MFNSKQERITDFITLWKNYASEENDDLIIGNNKLMNYLETGGFFTAPASTKYHGAYEGGLYDHSRQVFLRLKDLTEKNDLVWEREESPFFIGMFHDLCKCDQYIKKEGTRTDFNGLTIQGDGLSHYEYNPDTLLKGHGEKSVLILSHMLTLTEEEMLCIRYHMGAYEKDEWPEYDKAIRKANNLLYVNLADMLASKVDDI